MNQLAKIFQRYTGLLRSLKASYVINNLIHANALTRNRVLYKKFGLKKSIFAPIGQKDFASEAGMHELPWLDRPDALRLLAMHPDFAKFDTQTQLQLKQFVTDGYMVFEDFVDDESIDTLNKEVDTLLSEGQTSFNYTGRKIIELHETSVLARERFFKNPKLLELFRFMMQKNIIPFQTLNFVQGSEQRPHSDSIHMMTYPPGFMVAAWYALEDCTLENGPLVYYPGSHRLPYISTTDYESGNTAFTIGEDSNIHYEDKIAEMISAQGLQPQYFLAKKGSVLIWHANLIHGGSPILKANSTRKSMVCHYYCDEVICYHEMSQRPALLPKQ